MSYKNSENKSYVNILTGIVGALLFAVLLYLSKLIITPLLIYFLILVLYIFNREEKIIRILFYLSSVIFGLWIFNELFSILIPFIFAFFIAYLLNPFVKFFEKRKIPMWLGSLISILLFFGFIGLLLSMIIPPFITQVTILISTAPEKFKLLQDYINTSLLPQIQKLSGLYPELEKFLIEDLPTRFQDLIYQLLNNVLSLITGFGSIFNQIINLVIIPIISFYFLKDYDKNLLTFLNLFPISSREKVIDFGGRIDTIFGNYIRGFLIVALINGVVITTGLTLLKVKYAIVLGLISALLCAIPYFGIIIAFALGFIISLLSGIESWKLVLIPVLYFGENLIENSVYIPKVIGQKVGLHPLLILLAIFVFGYFWGILGLLIAVPVTALLISWFMKDEIKVTS